MYRTWEPFVAAVVCSTRGVLSVDLVSISPARGHLAPRGGANNVCDPAKPYSDTQVFEVDWRSSALGQDHNGPGAEGEDVGGGEVYLIVKTEEMQWSWKVVVSGED